MATVYALKRVANRAHNASIPDSDSIIARSIVADPTSAGGAATLWCDSKTTAVSIGTGATQTSFTIGGGAAYAGATIGKASVLDTFLGNLKINGSLQVSGTVTTINATSITTQDQVLTVAVTDRATAPANAVFAVYRGNAANAGATMSDALILWNDGSVRLDFGYGGTGSSGGTLPSAPTQWYDIKIKNLLLGGTAITADAGLTVSASSANLTLRTTSSGDINITSAGAIIAASSGASSWTNTVGNLTIATATSGTLELNSAGAISSVSVTTASFTGGSTMTVTGTTALNLTALGTSDITFTGRGQAYTFNDAGNVAFVAGITATSLVGAINQIYGTSSAANTVVGTYTNNTGGTIAAGLGVYITTTASEINKAIATTDSAAAQFIGVTKAAILTTASGQVITEGIATLVFEGGLTLANGQEVFLSAATAGNFTNIAPTSTGNVVLSVGFIEDVLTYDGVLDFNVSVQLVRGAKSVA